MTERNWDVTETFLSVWTSPFNYTWEKFTERWCSATERKSDVKCESALNHARTQIRLHAKWPLILSYSSVSQLFFQPRHMALTCDPKNQKYTKVNFTLEKATKTQNGENVYFYSLFKLCARWGWLVNDTPRSLDPRERPGTHCIGGWVDPRAGMDGCAKSRPHRDSISGPSTP